MGRRALLPVAAAGVLLAACAPPNVAKPTQVGDLNATRSAALGSIVTDAKGMVLYRYDADSPRPSVSNCTGGCAATWTPVLTGTGSVTLEGVDQKLVTTTTREDGSQQVAIAGWPLYRYTKDTFPGETAGQGVGGLWFVVTPSGGKATPAPSTSDTSGS